MFLRSPLTRLAVAAAAGALVTTAAVVPAVADAGRGGASGPAPVGGEATPSAATGTGAGSGTAAPGKGTADTGKGTAEAGKGTATAAPQSSAGTQAQVGGAADPGANGTRFYRGRVTARGGLALHSRPDRGSQVLRVARQGEVVWIYCKTPGQNVRGNNLWYLLADGTWAWGAARFIDNIGPAPRWC
ncbi:SH3 domain-containing protein [Streptomyces sp. NPDC018610]|uniref:SH3 domain-containing protein n=1 Tax=Streptomyces sp. NPDC018610 TaxID=3365049 RepID=UPI003796340E